MEFNSVDFLCRKQIEIVGGIKRLVVYVSIKYDFELKFSMPISRSIIFSLSFFSIYTFINSRHKPELDCNNTINL